MLGANLYSMLTVSVKFLVSAYLFAIAYFEVHDKIKNISLPLECLNTQFMRLENFEICYNVKDTMKKRFTTVYVLKYL